ncbi:MAG: ABC transporter permease [Alphaproteobacteria bacterium]|nr:ABC transporter permease [Alphaproteobacteria bacterium]
MLRYIVGRIIQGAVVLLVLSFVVYGLIGLMPGDPIDLMIQSDPNLTPADAKRLKALHGLDQPILDRYVAWLSDAVRGEFGYSRNFGQPVMAVIRPRIANTALLLGVSLALSLMIAIPIGVFAALKPYSKADYAVNLFCFAGISIPPFWLALMLIILFSVTLGWLPAGGMETVGGGGFLDQLRHMALPVLALTLASVGEFTRFMRASMLQTLRQDYIRTAHAKGVSQWRMVTTHALRNALLPMITIVALSIGRLFSGALITETMFSWLGMGKMIYDAILGNDYNLALVGLIFATLLTLVGNFLAEIGYVWLDPRVSLRKARA